MARRTKDLTGCIFGALTVLEPAERTPGGALRWLCRCECGTEVPILAKNLRSGRSQSCGCRHRHDLTGQSFGRLQVIGKGPKVRTGQSALWDCLCDCGQITRVRTDKLLSGHTKSCGCLRKEGRVRHGYFQTPTWETWRGMHERCRNPKHVSWQWYGDRGIRVCPEWDSFEQFLADMGERPAGKTLDRKDSDGDYTPENCRWATPTEQARNRS